MVGESGSEARSYRLVFSGRLLPGQREDEVRARLAELHKCDDAKIDRLFAGRDVVVASGLTLARAQAAQRSYAEVGAELRIEEQVALPVSAPRSPLVEAPAAGASGETVSCPACGFAQPAAPGCARCGLVFAKYQGGRQRTKPGELPAPSRDAQTDDQSSPEQPSDSRLVGRPSIGVLVGSLVEATVAGGGASEEARQIARDLRAAGSSRLASLRRFVPGVAAVLVVAVVGTVWLSHRGTRSAENAVGSESAQVGPTATTDTVRSAVMKLESALFARGVTSQSSLVRVCSCASSLEAALASSAAGSTRARDRATEAVREVGQRAVAAALDWGPTSTLTTLRAAWEPIRREHFADLGDPPASTPELDRAQNARVPSKDFSVPIVIGDLEAALSEAEPGLRDYSSRLGPPGTFTQAQREEVSRSFYSWVEGWRKRHGALAALSSGGRAGAGQSTWSPTLTELDAQRIGAGPATDLQAVLSGVAAGRQAVHTIVREAGYGASVVPATLVPVCENGLGRLRDAREALARLGR